jgi:AcrR family transcriptional regulator
MLGEPNGGRVALRRAATTAEILEASWALADRDGLGGFSLRDVAKAMGMQPPSLYSYVSSKNDLYDLMFRQAYAELIAEMTDLPEDPESALREASRRAFRYLTSKPARFTLIFLRTLPGFEPSEESFALALELYERLRGIARELGISDPALLDLQTALISGLMSQQIANDPGGDRWERLLDDALDMFLAHARPTPRRSRR